MAHSTKKGIFDANYLLPAWQNMNNFQHILHKLYLLFKYTNNSSKDSRLELPWQQLQEMPQKLLLYGQKYDKYWDLPKEKCEIETFQADMSFLLITFTTCSV